MDRTLSTPSDDSLSLWLGLMTPKKVVTVNLIRLLDKPESPSSPTSPLDTL
jgi:hypothetical protein